MTNLSYHPDASLFPLLEGDDYEKLKADIRENGQREPIWLHPDGSILDGRNRYRACKELGIEPACRTWEDDGNSLAFVLSLNLHRRHLNSSQRAAIAAQILPMLEEKARKRQATSTGGSTPQLTQTFGEAGSKHNGEASTEAARLTGTNRQYVSDAKAILKTDPALFEKVGNGDLSIESAKKIIRERTPDPAPLEESDPDIDCSPADESEETADEAERLIRLKAAHDAYQEANPPELPPAPSMQVHFSSKSGVYETPQELFDLLDSEFHFTLDVCATSENAKCADYFDENTDGLAQEWEPGEVCWMNPPYGRKGKIYQWLKKAYESAKAGATVVCLVPARTDTAWFWDFARHGEVRFLRGRLKFGDSESGAPFPSAVVVFWPEVPGDSRMAYFWDGWRSEEEEA